MSSDRRRFTKTLHRIAAAFALAAVGVGCGLIRDRSPEGRGMELGADQSQCLKGSLTVWQDWVNGRGDAQRIAAFWKCAGDSLEVFLKRTRGDQSDRYSPEELRSFLTKYFITSFQISDDMLDEAMILKEVMVGGSRTTVTDEEIHRILLWFDLFQKHSIALIPHMPLTPERLATLSRAKIDEATTALSQAAAEVGIEIEKQRQGYSFASLQRLVGELHNVSDSAGSRQIIGRMRLLTLLKSLLIGPDRTQITGTEWKRMLVEGARDFAVFVKFVAFRKNHRDWTYGAGRRALVELADDVVEVFQTALGRQNSGYIRFEQIDELIGLLEDDEIPMPSLAGNRRVLKDFLRPLFLHILGGTEANGQGRAARGLTRGLLDRVKASVHRWSRTQNALETAFASLAHIQTGRANDGVSRVGFTKAEILGTHPGGAVEALLKSAPSMYFQRDAEITFDSSPAGDRYWFRGLTRLNWMDELVRLLISGYAQAPLRAKAVSSLSQPEFHCFTDELRKIGIAGKFVDPRKYDMHYKRFTEANLFMYAADGNSILSRAETIQLLGYLTSSDAHAKRIYDKALPLCRKGPKDPLEFPTIESRCMREVYFGDFVETYRHMPDVISWYSTLTGDRRANFQRLVEESSRRGGYSELPIEIGDLQAMALVMQYVETIFARFDADRSGTLNDDEAMNAFPLFQRTLTQLVTAMVDDPVTRERALENDNLKALFAWFLNYGKQPDTRSITGKARFWAWTHQIPRWKFEADRSRILEIFVEMAKSGGEMPPAQTQHSSCWRD